MMAVGGAPDAATLAEWQENLQEQQDEILALQAIFESDAEERLRVLTEAGTDTDDDTGNMLQLFVPVRGVDGTVHVDVCLPFDGESAVDPGMKTSSGVTFSRSVSGRRLLWSFEAKHLSPLCLHVTLGASYPSRDAPSFVLSCGWLSPPQLSVLCRELDCLWAENQSEGAPGMPILYTWVDWLQENTLSVLGLGDCITVSTYQPDEEEDDCRAVVEEQDLELLVTNMMRYNRQQEMKEFYQSDHECGVCFDTLPGNKFFRLSECGHHVCQECMAAQCQTLVKDGSVQALNCPSYECKASIPQFIIKAVLSPEEFERYERLSLQTCLAVMGDIVWCPRCENAVVSEPEDGLYLARCATCFFAFCTECLEAWHQGETCKMELAKIEALKKKMEERRNKAKEKEEEIQRQLQQLIEDEQSFSYISRRAKKCPHCRSPIMKVSGCNKVTCTKCHKYMCWECGQGIDGYTHFNDNPKCNTFRQDLDIDNTDLPQIYRPYEAPVREPPRQPTKGRVIEEMLKRDATLKDKVVRCPSCKQKSLQESNSNHIRCWNCQCSLCFACKQKITGPVGKHFSGRAACNQHG